jgi:hypothetical protein
LYRDIKILHDWSERAAADDKELWKALTDQEYERESDEEPVKAAKRDDSEDTNSSSKKTDRKQIAKKTTP